MNHGGSGGNCIFSSFFMSHIRIKIYITRSKIYNICISSSSSSSRVYYDGSGVNFNLLVLNA